MLDSVSEVQLAEGRPDSASKGLRNPNLDIAICQILKPFGVETRSVFAPRPYPAQTQWGRRALAIRQARLYSPRHVPSLPKNKSKNMYNTSLCT